jgi:hypothetical protein
MVVVAMQKAQPESIEQEQRDPLAAVDAATHLIGDVGEGPVRSHAQNRHAFVFAPSQTRLVSSQGPGLAWVFRPPAPLPWWVTR